MPKTRRSLPAPAGILGPLPAPVRPPAGSTGCRRPPPRTSGPPHTRPAHRRSATSRGQQASRRQSSPRPAAPPVQSRRSRPARTGWRTYSPLGRQRPGAPPAPPAARFRPRRHGRSPRRDPGPWPPVRHRQPDRLAPELRSLAQGIPFPAGGSAALRKAAGAGVTEDRARPQARKTPPAAGSACRRQPVSAAPCPRCPRRVRRGRRRRSRPEVPSP